MPRTLTDIRRVVSNCHTLGKLLQETLFQVLTLGFPFFCKSIAVLRGTLKIEWDLRGELGD